MRFKYIFAAIALLGFIVFCTSLLIGKDRDIKKQKIEFQAKTIDLKAHQLKGQELETKLESELQRQDKNQERIKQLEDENAKYQQETQELQKQVKAKQEAQRVAANKATTAVANAITPKVSAQGFGGGCEWLAGRLAANGVSQDDIPAAINIATKESGCRQEAVNPSSGACNVFQEYPCGKWGGTANIDAHIQGAIGHANGYGGWWASWSHWQSAYNW